ncbi:cytochrome P450 [Mollisia scopiformis]|uniref:Cytochrome P450 n=1 Tax=Mollisia scopiformis TaxID=149040 RepID=A0A194WTJ5_MOLSC|nr:cytochrome P450 [Mollisia scopiformis]KUJ10994.1 cytochrome P450 [Mollisia scopiformis]
MKRTLISLFLVAFATHIIYYVTKRYLQHRADATLGRRHRCQPPPELPYRWPLGLDRIKELWDLNSEDYEPRNNLSQYLLIGPRAFHILHPRNVESLLSTNFTDYGFGVRRDVFAHLLGNGIFAQEGPAWKHSRELLRKQFIRTQYQNLDHFREHVDNLITHLPVDGVIDLQPLFFNLTLDTTTALLLGRSVYSLRADIDQDNENRLFAESFSIAQEGLAKRFRIAPWHFFYNPPKFRRACSNVHRFVERYIRERNLQNEKNAFGEESCGFIDQVAKESVSNEDLRDQLLNILLAGRDTTACCLSWTLEISSVMGASEHPSREQIRRMPFLACVIKESLRLYSPVPLNNRTATKTTILPTGGGPDGHSPILVRRGELVVFSQYVNSRMRSIFGSDADDFRPERWEGSGLSGIGWAYFPFSGGPRQCLGEDFALMEVSYTVVRLLQASSLIALPSGEKIEPVGAERQRLTLVLSSEDGCRVKIEWR